MPQCCEHSLTKEVTRLKLFSMFNGFGNHQFDLCFVVDLATIQVLLPECELILSKTVIQIFKIEMSRSNSINK